MSIRIILWSLIITSTLCACGPKPWSAAVRFEGGTSTPQVPLRIELRSVGGPILYSGVLEGRCLAVQLPRSPSLAGELLVDVSDVRATRIGAVRFRADERQRRYIPVDGQLCVVTVQAGATCK